MKVAVFLLPAALLFSTGCFRDHGQFAFFLADDSDLTMEQKLWFQPRQFRKYSPPVAFSRNVDIWYTYEPSSADMDKPYALSLSRHSLGWNEIDLKNQQLSSVKMVIMDKLPRLETGRYMLRVAHDNKVLDSFYFQVVPGEGQEDIDYDAPIADQKRQDSGDEDDITLLSAE